MNNFKRKKYWDEKYFKYHRKRIEEANVNENNFSSITKGDAKEPSDEIYKKIIDNLKIKGGKVLDVGCAWGRWFDLFSFYNLDIYGIDISKKMVEEARKKKCEKLVEVRESEAENIPYEDNTFDYVFCLGTFDATYQNEALKEMLRVLKVNGKLLVDGKSKSYYPDDILARKAEEGARKKGHPNFFADVKNLKKQLENNGHIIVSEYYFPRRGDFTEFNFKKEMPANFYEYFLVIEKKTLNNNFKKFHYKYSDNN